MQVYRKVETISKSIIIEQNYLYTSVLGFEDAKKYVTQIRFTRKHSAMKKDTYFGKKGRLMVSFNAST